MAPLASLSSPSATATRCSSSSKCAQNNNGSSRSLLFSFFLICVLSLLSSSAVYAKFVTGVAHLRSEDTEWYLGKFAFAADVEGDISGTLAPTERHYFDNRPHALMVSLYDDVAWARLAQLNARGALCSERANLADRHLRLSARPPSYPRERETITFHSKIPARKDTHYTYALLHDCALEDYPAKPPPLAYDVTFLNGESHLPADEEHMRPVLLVVLLIMLFAAVVYGTQLRAQQQQFQQVHLSALLLGLAFILQIIALLAQIAHISRYIEDGMGFKLRFTWVALDFLSEITQLFSELVVAFVLVCLAAGWTLSDSFHIQRIIFDKRAMSLLFLLTGLHLYLQYKGRVYESDFNHFHDFDHWPGLALIALRVLLCIVFWLGMSTSYGIMPDWVRRSRVYVEVFTVLGVFSKQQRAAAIASATSNAFSPTAPAAGGATGSSGLNPFGERVRVGEQQQQQQQQPLMGSSSLGSGGGMGSVGASEGFVKHSDPAIVALLRQILFIGTAWFLSFPVSTAISLVMAPASRRVLIISCSLFAQLGVLLFLLYSFLWSTSRFYAHSSLRNMGTMFSAAGTGGNFIRKAALD